MKFVLLITLLVLLVQPTYAAKIVSTVSSTVETDVTGLTGGVIASSAIIIPNGTAYDVYTDDGLLVSSDFDYVWNVTIKEIVTGDVILRSGLYRHNKIIDIPQGISLRGETGAILEPTKNIDMIRMRPGSSLSGIALEPRRLTGYNHTAIFISSEDPWSDFFPAAYRYHISDVDIWGDTGTALLLDATGTPGYNPDNGVGGYICGVVASNVNVLGFDDGLLLKCDTNHSFINGNTFSNFHFTCTKKCVVSDANDNKKGIDGNIFENFHVQYTPGMELAFYISGRYNRISAMIWDWTPDTAVIFPEGTGQNYALLGIDQSKVDDRGLSFPNTRNTIIGYI